MELLQEPSTQVRPSVYMSFACCDLRQIYVPFVAKTVEESIINEAHQRPNGHGYLKTQFDIARVR
jgi:hypothetical protein